MDPVPAGDAPCRTGSGGHPAGFCILPAGDATAIDPAASVARLGYNRAMLRPDLPNLLASVVGGAAALALGLWLARALAA